MILKGLLRRKTRTLLTLVGIAIGVAAVVALSGMAEGFINSFSTILTSSGADIIVTQADSPDILFSAVDDVVGPQIAVIPGVKAVSGIQLAMVSTADAPYFFVFALDPKEFGIRHYRVVKGKSIAGPRQMLLGQIPARDYHKKVGDYYKIQNISFRIVGIYETGENVEENGAVISLKEAQEIFKKPNQVAFYQIQVERPDLVPTVLKQLEHRFPKLTASRSANYMDNSQETMMLRAMGWFIGLLAMLAGGLVMMNTMLMSVFERTREIGVLRALGWRRGRVLRMILGEALLLSLAGGLLGNAMGVALLAWANQLPVLAGFLNNAYSPTLFLEAMLIAAALGAAGGLYPAWRAAGLQPVEAMRYEGTSAKSRTKNEWERGSFLVGGMALRNVLRQRTRTLLTLLAIGVSVGLVVALGGMGEGLIEQMSAIGSQSGDLTITETKASDISVAAIDDKVGRYVATLPAVQHVSGMLIVIASAPGMPYLLAFGYDPTCFAIRRFAITEGERLRNPHEMILGKIAAKNLHKRVGDNFQMVGSNYRIVGIYETGVAYEDAAGVISLQEAQRLFKKPNQVSMYGIKLKDPGQADSVKKQIESRFSQVSVSRSTEFAEKLNDMNTFRIMTNTLSFISILVGGVGMMNAMLMSVYERTREIGTLRALGWKRRRVVGMILSESLLLSILSGLAGIALGVGLGTLITLEPSMGSFLKGSYTLPLLSQAMIIALVLGGIGGLYPAWRASSLSPIEALRYE
ncbi:MAG: ABC transporter permease [Chloroflexi bacterium]|nr:ABC transporter permease [Chloroflexota bacterium]